MSSEQERDAREYVEAEHRARLANPPKCPECGKPVDPPKCPHCGKLAEWSDGYRENYEPPGWVCWPCAAQVPDPDA